MFAKLKKKIQDDETGSPGQSMADSRPVKPLPGPGIASPVKLEFPVTSPVKKESVWKDYETASVSSEVSDIRDTASKEDLLKKILKKNELIKKLESKITDLAAMIKERNKNIEKLEKSIDKQKEESRRQLEEMNVSVEAERTQFRETGADQLKRRVHDLEKEKKNLQQIVEEAEKYKSRALKSEEEKQELAELKLQELAQVQLTLSKCQDDLGRCQNELSEKTAQLLTSQQKVKDVENEVQSLMEQITQLTHRSEVTDEENLRNKAALEDLQGVQKELSAATRELKSTRESMDKLQHSHDVLQKNSDLHQNKMSKLVEEKDEHICHLRERVQTLEKRLENRDLSGDERLEALEKERTGLEMKLSEAREHLSQVKSSWSDKINHHEAQIANLNRKIADDNEELLDSKKEIEQIKQHHQAKVDELQRSVERLELECKNSSHVISAKEQQLQSMKNEHGSEMLREKLHWTSLETELREKISDLHKDIDSLQRTREHDKHTTQQKISKLESSQEDWLEKEIDREKQITSLEDEVQELKRHLAEKDELLMKGGEKEGLIKELRQKIQESERNVDAQTNKVKEMKQEAEKFGQEYQNCMDEKDSLLLRNAQLSQEFESFKRRTKDHHGDLEMELQQKNQSIAGLESVLLDMQAEAQQLKLKVNELENQQMVAITDLESEEIKTLQREIKELEEQLLDRNKTVKKLQQRMGDLKKTLQRELNVQALPNDQLPDSTSRASQPQGYPNNSNNKDVLSVHNNHTSKNTALSAYQNSSGDTLGSLPVTSSTTVNVSERHKKFYEGASDFSASDLENIAISMATGNHNNRRNNKTSRTYAGVQYDRDINFDYLKHVIMKFILSRESESVHLVKAVAVLLDLSQDEQKLMRETLEYRMSWFGTKPSLGQGQYSKFIPPSL